MSNPPVCHLQQMERDHAPDDKPYEEFWKCGLCKRRLDVGGAGNGQTLKEWYQDLLTEALSRDLRFLIANAPEVYKDYYLEWYSPEQALESELDEAMTVT